MLRKELHYAARNAWKSSITLAIRALKQACVVREVHIKAQNLKLVELSSLQETADRCKNRILPFFLAGTPHTVTPTPVRTKNIAVRVKIAVVCLYQPSKIRVDAQVPLSGPR
jgi:hypothetical protein